MRRRRIDFLPAVARFHDGTRDEQPHKVMGSVDLRQPSRAESSTVSRAWRVSREVTVMLRYILAALAAVVLLTVSLIPDDAYARRGGGGGYRGGGGGMHAGRIHDGAGRFHGGGRYAGRLHPSHPIVGRPGRPIAGYPGYGGGYYRPGWGYGAAVAGTAAAAGAYGAYSYYGNNGCYYDNYGQLICPQQYPYRYRY